METPYQKEKSHIIKNENNGKPIIRTWNNLPLITKPMKLIRNQSIDHYCSVNSNVGLWSPCSSSTISSLVYKHKGYNKHKIGQQPFPQLLLKPVLSCSLLNNSPSMETELEITGQQVWEQEVENKWWYIASYK